MLLKENLYLCRDLNCTLFLSDCICETKSIKENDNGTIQTARNNNTYASLFDARTQICAYLNEQEFHNVHVDVDFDGIFYKRTGDFIPIRELVQEKQSNL